MTWLSAKMLLRSFIIMIMVCSTHQGKAQHTPNDLLRSTNWDIIGTLDFKLEANNDVYPIFSKELKKYANQDFELTGYLIPIREGMRQTRFLLSTLPINQCFYCGRNGIPIMILVEMTEGIKFTYRPVKLKGKLRLKNINIRDYPPIVLTKTISLD